jgi:chorismate mutase
VSNSNPRFEPDLQHARQSIDMIDDKIIALLTERSVCVASIAVIKRQNQLAALNQQLILVSEIED